MTKSKLALLTVSGWPLIFGPLRPRSNHQFYVEIKTERSTWLHPYDDPEYLASLPDTHPANPNSEQAHQARAQHEAITKAAQQKKAGSSSGGRQDVHAAAQAAMAGGRSQGNQSAEERSFGGKLKDKILGSTKEERRKAKAEQRERDRVRHDCTTIEDLIFLMCASRKLPSNTWLEERR